MEFNPIKKWEEIKKKNMSFFVPSISVVMLYGERRKNIQNYYEESAGKQAGKQADEWRNWSQGNVWEWWWWQNGREEKVYDGKCCFKTSCVCQIFSSSLPSFFFLLATNNCDRKFCFIFFSLLRCWWNEQHLTFFEGKVLSIYIVRRKFFVSFHPSTTRHIKLFPLHSTQWPYLKVD